LVEIRVDPPTLTPRQGMGQPGQKIEAEPAQAWRGHAPQSLDGNHDRQAMNVEQDRLQIDA
jgi:hypothetical protein